MQTRSRKVDNDDHHRHRHKVTKTCIVRTSDDEDTSTADASDDNGSRCGYTSDGGFIVGNNHESKEQPKGTLYCDSCKDFVSKDSFSQKERTSQGPRKCMHHTFWGEKAILDASVIKDIDSDADDVLEDKQWYHRGGRKRRSMAEIEIRRVKLYHVNIECRKRLLQQSPQQPPRYHPSY